MIRFLRIAALLIVGLPLIVHAVQRVDLPDGRFFYADDNDNREQLIERAKKVYPESFNVKTPETPATASYGRAVNNGDEEKRHEVALSAGRKWAGITFLVLILIFFGVPFLSRKLVKKSPVDVSAPSGPIPTPAKVFDDIEQAYSESKPLSSEFVALPSDLVVGKSSVNIESSKTINDSTKAKELDAIYDAVGLELEGGNLDRATWTRAFAEADGDDAKARAGYIRLRVAKLMAAYQEEQL